MQIVGMTRHGSALLAATALLGSVHEARADEAQPPATFQLGGYAEGFYQWNFGRPSNGITHYRGFDNRHNTFTLSNVALSASWDMERIVGLVALQVGHTPSTYYLAEPALAGASGTNATSAELWKYVQQAYAGYRFDIGRGLLVQAGLFLSPIGPEGMAVRDNWNFSRSNLFFGLPFYHTGARVTYPLSDAWALTLACYNGWNSVVDNNEEKSLGAQVTYTRPDKLALSLLYFTGVERPRGAPEGRAWRHLVDAHATVHPTDRLSFIAHLNGGTEPNRFGTSAWIAGALYARVRVSDKLYLAARGDAFHERVPSNGNGEGAAAAIFWPVSWVASGTATADFRPHERASFRLEYRHDHAAGNMYFGGAVPGNGVDAPFVPNRPAQDTVTLGATTWF
ncbi:porin [Polyangium jinanense]|uniref:Porin n=2 Tax=Polyangium jinanense TaxID=2829994 RepID=A0A9X3X303_9BACT|nr:outer membrane beta-barrel protein [Polyangium jinanense]MDC3958373.1 porin [Polyangium jinanense]MDC3983292.1 porin [Polyangium jinanense]